MGDRPFLVIDTGGFEPVVKEGVLQEMAKQTKQAVAEADVVIFYRRRTPGNHASRQKHYRLSP